MYPNFTLGPTGWIIAAVVTLAAGLLRFWNLANPQELIFDETYYVKDAYSLWHFGYERSWSDDVDEAFAAGNAQPGEDASYVVHPPAGKWLIAAGMALFGFENAFGWRFSAALVGTLAVLVTFVLAAKLFRSLFLASTAGVLLAVEGHHIVMSRVGLLDIFLGLFVLGAFCALVADRTWGRRRLVAELATRYRRVVSPAATDDDKTAWHSTMPYGPWLGWRPWRIAAGVLLGVAVSIKLSGLAFVAVFGLLTVWWDANARKTAGIRRWLPGATVLDGLWAFVSVVIVGAITYVGTWLGWIISSGGYYRNWGAENPSILPDWLASLIHYHVQSTQFHTGLDSDHNYASSAWTWPFAGRPVSFFYRTEEDGVTCAAEQCSAAILDLPNPLIWWTGLLALVFIFLRWLLVRDWRAGAILAVYVAGQLIWVIWPERTMFFFYTVAYVPFLILAIVYVAGLWLNRTTTAGTPISRQVAILAIGMFVLLALVVSAYFLPVWTGEPISLEQWQRRMWLQSWI
ncbi:phospholipid carrier-dependent glycosyltransferase [Yaniella flava]|uniref:Polyprenol-phosphate-mannose--protein mannosyltransferase n=1 Tax=Yaniella flava TaxID=287930 RepID=A0ABP5FIT4_9MICC